MDPRAPGRAVSLLAFESIDKRYTDGPRTITVLEGASFELHEGETLGVRGSRRSGKSTLLKLAAGLQIPDRGLVRFAGHDLAKLSQDGRARLWREELAFAFFDELGPSRGAHVIEHVALPLLSTGRFARRQAHVRARNALDRTGGLEHANALLGGISQEDLLRVELARALVREPSLLLVDEPPVLRSPSRRTALYRLLRSLGEEPRLAVILASEDLELIQGMPLMMLIGGGRLWLVDNPGEVLRFPGARAAGHRRR